MIKYRISMNGGKNVWKMRPTKFGLLVVKLWAKNKKIKSTGAKLRMSLINR